MTHATTAATAHAKDASRPAVDDAKLRRTEPLEAIPPLSIDIGIIDGGTPLRQFQPAGYARCGFGQESRLRPQLSGKSTPTPVVLSNTLCIAIHLPGVDESLLRVATLLQIVLLKCRHEGRDDLVHDAQRRSQAACLPHPAMLQDSECCRVRCAGPLERLVSPQRLSTTRLATYGLGSPPSLESRRNRAPTRCAEGMSPAQAC